jgi:hypothetical protein
MKSFISTMENVKLTILLSFLLLSHFSVASEEKTTYIIDVERDGSATFTMERKIFLLTEEEREEFEKYDEESIKAQFKKEWESIIQLASDYLGREMSAENFDVLILQVGKTGSIKFQFRWLGFAEVKNEKILLGDVFLGGLYLFKEDVLIIRIPEGYKVDSVAPKPDSIEGELIWNGPKDFLAGQPRMVLSKVSFPFFWLLLLLLVIPFVVIKRRKIKIEESDERKIVELLRSSGGSMYQSEIKSRTRFSKSKISSLLNEMKKKGMIQKIRKGRENLIRLK